MNKKVREQTLDYIRETCPHWVEESGVEDLINKAIAVKEADIAVFDATMKLMRETRGKEGVDRLLAYVLGHSTYHIHTLQDLARWFDGLKLHPDIPLSAYRALAEIVQTSYDEDIKHAAKVSGGEDKIPVVIGMEIESRHHQMAEELYNDVLAEELSARELRDRVGIEKYARKRSTVPWLKGEARVLKLGQTTLGGSVIELALDARPSGKVPDRVELDAREILKEERNER